MNSVLNHDKVFILQLLKEKKTYEVLHQQSTGSTIDITLQYEMEITLLNNVNVNELVYEIDRKNLLINGGEPDQVFDQLAYECGNVLFPLKFSVNKSNEIVQIFEHEKMIERWNIVKERLLDYYEGEPAINYIGFTNRNINNPETLKRMMQNHLFVYFFYKPFYQTYQDGVTEAIWKSAPFMGFDNEIVMSQILMRGRRNEQDNGLSNDETQLEIQSSGIHEIEIKGKYTFNVQNNSIDSCQAKIILEDKKEINMTFITKQEAVVSN